MTALLGLKINDAKSLVFSSQLKYSCVAASVAKINFLLSCCSSLEAYSRETVRGVASKSGSFTLNHGQSGRK